MRNISEGVRSHLQSGVTTICRCWKIARKDGVVLGFSDHDQDLTLDGVVFEASSGLDATALQTATGLSVDNTDASGLLSSDGISEADISAGKYDNAVVSIWIVNWQNPVDRYLIFSGSIGEITYSHNSFTAELRGMAEPLNAQTGRNFSKQCSARLGDSACRFDLSSAPMRVSNRVRRSVDQTTVFLDDIPTLDVDWFAFGILEFNTGLNAGQVARVIGDKSVNSERQVLLMDEVFHPIEAGDEVVLIAGCDKQLTTCVRKFQNAVNFQGFPDIPGEDWMTSFPKSANSEPL